MGTTYRVVLPVDSRVEEVGEQSIADIILAELSAVDEAMSTWKPDSEVSQFNRHRSLEPFSVSAETLEVVARAQQVSEATTGAFDITVGPLIDAWGFGSDDPGPPPQAEQLVALAERVGYRHLHVDLESGALAKRHPELEIDLSAIAKGYAVDRVAQALRQAGIVSALVEVGGEISALGRPGPDRKWRVAIERPDGSGTSHKLVELEAEALATSGDYRSFRLLDDGRTISHIFDPRTATPIEHAVASVSVVASDCATADAWATALFVLGPDQAATVAKPQGLTAVFILHGEAGWEELQLD